MGVFPGIERGSHWGKGTNEGLNEYPTDRRKQTTLATTDREETK